MELESTQTTMLQDYLSSFEGLIGDQRTQVTFEETVKGISVQEAWYVKGSRQVQRSYRRRRKVDRE